MADVFYIMPTFFIFTHPICGHQEACRTEVTKKNNDVAETQNIFPGTGQKEAGIILTTKKNQNYDQKCQEVGRKEVKMRTFNTKEAVYSIIKLLPI